MGVGWNQHSHNYYITTLKELSTTGALANYIPDVQSGGWLVDLRSLQDPHRCGPQCLAWILTEAELRASALQWQQGCKVLRGIVTKETVPLRVLSAALDNIVTLHSR